MFHETILTFTLLIVCFNGTYVFAAMSEEEYRHMLVATSTAAEKCFEIFDFKSSESVEIYNQPDYKYFINCLFTECGIMEKGLLNVENFMAFTKRYLHRENELARSYKIRQKCSKVNKVDVTNAERAMLLFNCLKKNGDHFLLADEEIQQSQY